jgi:hypothetical protein
VEMDTGRMTNQAMARILGLPVEEPTGDVDRWMRRFARATGEWSFHPHQAAAFDVLASRRGGFFPWSVGAGKSLAALFMPAAAGFEPDEALILTPAAIKREMAALHATANRHFKVPRVRVESYETLSAKGGVDLLARLAPKFLVLDEAHMLSNGKAARTNRVARVLQTVCGVGDDPATNVVVMSGSFLRKSVKDFAHLAEWALGRDESFVTTQFSTLEALSRVLDDFNPAGPPGRLEWFVVGPLCDWAGEPRTREGARRAFHKRMTTAPGVVPFAQSSCDARLVLEVDREPVVEVERGIEATRRTWELPNGVEVLDALRLSAKLRELSQGAYWFPVYDGGHMHDNPAAVAWDHTRREASRAVLALAAQGRPGLDSPGLVKDAHARGEIVCPALDAWIEVEPDVECTLELDVVSDAPARRALEHARRLVSEGAGPVLVWYWHRFVPDFDTWAAPGVAVWRAGERPVPSDDVDIHVVSVASHGTGLNLQWAGANVVMCPPSNGASWEQLLGRTHRGGQTRDAIRVVVMAHTQELASALKSARADAAYYESAYGADTKLGIANEREH